MFAGSGSLLGVGHCWERVTVGSVSLLGEVLEEVLLGAGVVVVVEVEEEEDNNIGVSLINASLSSLLNPKA